VIPVVGIIEARELVAREKDADFDVKAVFNTGEDVDSDFAALGNGVVGVGVFDPANMTAEVVVVVADHVVSYHNALGEREPAEDHVPHPVKETIASETMPIEPREEVDTPDGGRRRRVRGSGACRPA
jgi:isocitrate dehydrogenase